LGLDKDIGFVFAVKFGFFLWLLQVLLWFSLNFLFPVG
jgi:hypothetical protein